MSTAPPRVPPGAMRGWSTMSLDIAKCGLSVVPRTFAFVANSVHQRRSDEPDLFAGRLELPEFGLVLAEILNQLKEHRVVTQRAFDSLRPRVDAGAVQGVIKRFQDFPLFSGGQYGAYGLVAVTGHARLPAGTHRITAGTGGVAR